MLHNNVANNVYEIAEQKTIYCSISPTRFFPPEYARQGRNM